MKHRLQAIEKGVGLDWATAEVRAPLSSGLFWADGLLEAMAFGSLMLEGCDVRISGQDVGRGTFSQRSVIIPRFGDFMEDLQVTLCRHAMLVDQKSESVVVPLNTELGSSGKLELANSMCFVSRGVSTEDDSVPYCI